MDSSSSSGVYAAAHTPITLSTFYDYDPLLGILVAAAVLFGLQTVVLAYQAVRSRTLFLAWLVVFAACEAGGYVAFCAFRVSPSLNAYLAELILIILAPNFVTLVNYIVISRIIPWSRFPAQSFLARRGKLVPTFFLTSDLLCLTLQAIGGSQLSQSQSQGVFDQAKFNLGRDLNLAGISAQLGFQTVFALLALYVYARMPAVQLKRELRWAWLCMLLTMVLVSVRNIYRIIEFASGRHAAIDDTSVPYFVLDTLLMLLTAAVFIALDLGSDWVLPAYIRKGAMMDTAAEQARGEAEVASSAAAAAAAHAGKGKGKGDGVVVVEMQQQQHDLHTAHTPTSESESATRAEHSV